MTIRLITVRLALCPCFSDMQPLWTATGIPGLHWQSFPFQHLIINLRICSLFFCLFIFREQLWLSAAPWRSGLWEFCWTLNHHGRHDFCYPSLWGTTAHRLGGRGWMQPCKDDQLITKHLCYYSPFIIWLFLSFPVMYSVFIIFPASHHMHCLITWKLTAFCNVTSDTKKSVYSILLHSIL